MRSSIKKTAISISGSCFVFGTGWIFMQWHVRSVLDGGNHLNKHTLKKHVLPERPSVCELSKSRQNLQTRPIWEVPQVAEFTWRSNLRGTGRNRLVSSYNLQADQPAIRSTLHGLLSDMWPWNFTFKIQVGCSQKYCYLHNHTPYNFPIN